MADIIVIEDDPMVRKVITDILEAEGYQTRGVGQGADGISLIREYMPELVLCDISMPELDGYGVLQRLRSDPETQTTLFIFLTGNADRESMRKGMELGADDFITKPFSRDELLQAVNTQLGKSRVADKKPEAPLELLQKSINYTLPRQLSDPLSIMLGNADLLIEDYDHVRPDQLLTMAQAITKNGRRIHRLFGNYLIYAQIELLMMEPRLHEALRNHVVRDAAVVIRRAARETAAAARRQDDLRVDVQKMALHIAEGDLEKIVQELVDNALKFSDPGTRITVQSAGEGRQYILYVEDSGCGMTAEQIDRISASPPFDRVVYEQQGLGLAIVKRLVELHEAELDVSSSPDTGTKVFVRFPL
jgi:two-component system sensor histidine kinase/response regulator